MPKRNPKRSYVGLWIILVAAIVLESTACIQYYYSYVGIREATEQTAQIELQRTELEINVVTAQMETALRLLAMMAERHVDEPEAIFSITESVVASLPNVSNLCVGYVPDYFPDKGHWFEVYSSREYKDGEEYIYTRQIGGPDHDYLQMEWYHNGLTIDSCWWSEPYYDNSGACAMVVSCSYPIRNAKGDVVAVALVDFPLEQLQHISEYLKLYKDSYYSIKSGNGVDMTEAPDTLSGRYYHIFEEEIDATGWRIAIIIPDSAMYAHLRRIGIIVLLLMFMGLGILIFIIWRAGRDMVKLVESTATNERIEKELQIANSIQVAMLPKAFPPFLDRLDLNIYGSVKPAKEVGGDLYDFFIRHSKLFFCIGDVSGKGVPASLVMAMVRSAFRNVSVQIENPADIMRHMNNTMAEQNEQEMFVTLFLGILDLPTGRLEYCNAGHDAPVLMSRGAHNTPRKIAKLPIIPNLPLGIVPDFDYQLQTVQMHYDDLLFLYTDGLTEAENGKHEQYGEARMMNVLFANHNTRPREVVDEMHAGVDAFTRGAQQSDDLTMLAIRYQTPALVMRNDIQQIPTLAEWIDALGIPMELNMPINLALEEAVSNVMLYAYPNAAGRVLVEFVRFCDEDNNRIIFTISDEGVPFDPTNQPPADIAATAEDRAIGGLGIHLVMQLMDSVVYRREDGKNILTLIKNIK